MAFFESLGLGANDNYVTVLGNYFNCGSKYQTNIVTIPSDIPLEKIKWIILIQEGRGNFSVNARDYENHKNYSSTWWGSTDGNTTDGLVELDWDYTGNKASTRISTPPVEITSYFPFQSRGYNYSYCAFVFYVYDAS